MPVLNVSHEERKLIPYRVQALYELGRISKEQLDNYVKTGSEEYLRSYEENLRTDPARQVGNLAAPEKPAPVAPPTPAPESTLSAMGLWWSTRNGEKDVNDEFASIAEESNWFDKIDQASRDDKFRQSLLDESKAKRDAAWKALQERSVRRRDTLPNPNLLKDIEQYDKLTEALDNAKRDPEYTKKQKETLAQRMESLRQKTANIRSKFQAAEQGLSGGTGFARAVVQGVSNWEQYLPQATGAIGGLIGGGLAVASGGGIPATGLAATGGNIAGSALGSYPLAKRVYNDSYAKAILNNNTPEEAAQYAFEKTSLEFVAEMAASLIPGGNTPGLRTATKSAAKPILRRLAGGVGRQVVEENLTDIASQTLDISKLGSGNESEALQRTRIENLPFDEQGRFDPQKFAQQRYETALAAAVGGTVASAIPSIKEGRAAVADVNARIAQGKAVYENIAKSGADIATLSEARTAIARSLGLEADTIEDAKTLANRFKQKSVPNSTRAKAVAETIMTGDPAFDAGQKAAQQTFQLAEQYKPVEATVTQFEPLARRPATPVQGNLGSFTVEAPVAKETLTERGLKKANLRLDKDTRMLDMEIANLRSQLGTKVDPITGVDPVRAQLAEAETLREGIARERLRTAEKAKPAEPTPYAKEMRRFQEQPKVEVNAKIPEAPKISRAESITNKVAEEVQTKTKKELPEDIKKRVTSIAGLVERELGYTGELSGLDEAGTTNAVLAKTREYLAQGVKEETLTERVTGLKKQSEEADSERLKTASTALKNQDEVLATLDRSLGKDVVDGLIRSDKVRVLADFDRTSIAKTDQERQEGQGVYVDRDGTIYLNAKNLAGKKDDKGKLKREIAMAVLAHEQGHTKNFRTEDGKRVPLLKGLAGDAAYDALNRAITDASTKGGRIGDIAKRAQERAQKGVDAAQKAGRQVELKDELPQYFVEELMNTYDGPLGQFRKFIDETSAKARDIINRSPLKMDIRPQDLGWMVKQDLIAESKTPKTKGTKETKLSLGTKEATGFKEAKQQGKTFTSLVTGEEVFEIPDTDMKVNAGILRAANGKPIDLETALVHDELFKQWPFLRKDVKIKLTDKFALNEAEYDPRTKTITLSTQNVDNIYNFALSAEAKKEARKDISKTVLHEITHAIQDKIGAEMGSNPTFEMYEYVADKLRNMNNNKLAAEYSRVLNAVKRNQKNVDKLFQGISKLRDQWEAKGKEWPETYTDLDIHIANDPALAGQIMPFVKGLGLNNLRELHETYNFLRQAKNAGYWAYMANRGEVTARAVAHVFDGKFATLKEAEEAVAKQFGELSTQGNSKAAFQTFEKQAPQMKAKPAALMSLGDTIEVDGKTRPTTNSKGQPIADSAESVHNFWQWFGDSKVVDAQGRPLVVYHGTNADFSVFDAANGGSASGAKSATMGFFAASNPAVASSYANDYNYYAETKIGRAMQAVTGGWYEKFNEAILGALGTSAIISGGNVMPLYLSIKNPKVVDFGGREYRERTYADVIDQAKRDGHDGVILRNTFDEGYVRGGSDMTDVYVTFDSTQIKSVNNRGSWDKNDPRILMSLGDTVEVDGVQRPTTNSKGQSIADSVESARNFWRWFGDSKVVDKDGNPIIMYHGTNKTEGGEAFSVFDAYGSNYGLFGQGVYFTDDPDIASEYTSKGKGRSPTVYPAYMAINNPIDMDAAADPAIWKKAYRDVDFEEFKPEGNTNESYYRAVEDYLSYEGLPRYEGAEIIQDGLRNMGHDGITHIGGGRVRSEGKRHRVFIAFDPEQIKSVNNRGSWNKNDPRILMSLGEDVKTKAQETYNKAAESGLWKIVKGLAWDQRPSELKIIEEMRDGYIRYAEQKVREMAKAVADASAKNGVTLEKVNEAWLEPQDTGILGDTGSAEVNARLQAARDEIDNFTQMIEDVHDEAGNPLSDKMKETFRKRMYSYISRSFEIDYDNQWGKNLLKAAAKNPESNEAKIILELRDWIKNDIVSELESLDLLDEKQINKLYARLIDKDTKDVEVQKMKRDLEKFKGKMSSEELTDTLQSDILRLSKSTGISNYYRGAARNDGILKNRKDLPSPLLVAWGERTGFAESFMTTVVRQAAMYAQTKMLADFRKALPDSFTDEQTPANTVRIENNQGKYGPLAGLYTTPQMKEYVETRVTTDGSADALLSSLHSIYAQNHVLTKAIEKGLGITQMVAAPYKIWTIMTNLANYIYNNVNGAVSLARYSTLGTVYGMDYTDKDGNKIPVHKWFPELAADFLWRGSVTGNKSHDLYGLAITADFVGSAMSGDIKEAFLDTIRQTVQGKKPSRIKSAWHKAVWLADAWFSAPEALPNILGTIVESNYLRALWTEQGREFTHDDLMAAAADRVKRNSISRGRAIPLTKILDRSTLTMYSTFFSETARAPIQTMYDVAKDLKSANDPSLSDKAKTMMRGHAMAHLAGAASAAGVMYGLTQIFASILGHPFGSEDGEDPNGLDEELRARPEDLVVIGTDKDGRKLVYDLSKLNTYALPTSVTREILEGNLDDALNQASNFLFANTLWKTAITEFTDKYGEAGKSDLALTINNAIAGTAAGQVVDPTAVNEIVKILSMFNPGIVKDPIKAFENKEGLENTAALAMVVAGGRPLAYNPVRNLQYQMRSALEELEFARSKLNAVMRTKGVNEEVIKQEMRRYYNAERDLILKNRPLVQAALKNETSQKELRQLFKFLGANKHLNEQMLSKEPYKPTAMHKNWLTMSQKLATFGESEKVKEEQGMIYSQNKTFYKKLFDELYGNKGVN